MAALAGAWIAFPIILLAAACGWGLLVEQATGVRLPGPLLPALGLAAVGALLELTTRTAHGVSLPLTALGVVAGYGLCLAGRGPRRIAELRPSGEIVLAALGAYALLAAPIVLTGAPSVSGFIRLDDSATFLGLSEHALTHGRSAIGLAPSTYETMIQSYLPGGYPLGAVLPLVAIGRLQGQDLIWLYAPYLAVLGGLLAVALDLIARPMVERRWARVLVAVLASCSALLLGYVLWGGIKEIYAAALLGTMAALVPWTVTAMGEAAWRGALRSLVPLFVIACGIVGALSLAGVVWILPALAVLAAGVATVRGRGRIVPAIVLGAFVAGIALLPVVKLVPFVKVLSAPRVGAERLGNLLEPISLLHLAGVWPAVDFRIARDAPVLSGAIIAVVILTAVAGLAWAVARRAWGPLAYGAVLASAIAVTVISDWPWANAKALALASPVPLLLAGVGAGRALSTRWRPVGGAALAVMTVGVLWSYGLAFHGTTLTPYDRHHELERIGNRFAGQGPTLITEFDPYSARWFLRQLDSEGASELRRRQIPLNDGSLLQKGESADIDAFQLASLAPYRLLVLRRSPAASRPPSSFRLAYSGRFYEVWERQSAPGTVVAHLGLGNAVDPAAVASCKAVRGLAQVAGPNGFLRAATAPRPALAGIDPAGAPASWQPSGSSGSMIPAGGGTSRSVITVPSPGIYDLWLGGAFTGRVSVAVDGRPVSARRHELSYAGLWVPFGTVELAAGAHAVTVTANDGALHPGTGGINRFAIGPIALTPARARRAIVQVPSSHAAELCGRRFDWVEAVR